MSSLFQSSVPEEIVAMGNSRIFVAGDIILDVYVEGHVNRLSPEAPVPVVLETGRKYIGGGAANVAANVAAMGATVVPCGRLGHDEPGSKILEIFRDFKIDCRALLSSSDTPTITKTRIMSGNLFSPGVQQLVRIDHEVVRDLRVEEENQVIECYKQFLAEGGNRCLILSDYGKGFLTSSLIQSLIQLSKHASVPVVTDPKSTDVSRYAGSTVIKPNFTEGRSVFRSLNPGLSYSDFQEEAAEVANCYLTVSGCENIVMSLSEHGVICQGNALPKRVHIATRALQVADVSGAGDTLISFLAMGLAAGLPVERATELGNIAAGIVCGKPGTATVSPAEFLQAFKNVSEHTHPEKTMPLQALVHIVRELKAQKRKVVFTNGCFDILHAGHVDYLQKARTLGDILVVGLNSDTSIQRLKGPKRPVQAAPDRAAILAALACVDYVIIFEDDTPLELILALKPDILVKGADYSLENTVGAKEVLAAGGRVEHISLIPGRSTSSIIQRVRS